MIAISIKRYNELALSGKLLTGCAGVVNRTRLRKNDKVEIFEHAKFVIVHWTSCDSVDTIFKV